MKQRRRDFLKITGYAGLGITGGALKGMASMSEFRDKQILPLLSRQPEKEHVQSFNMSGYSSPKLSTVRIGIIGLGNRGPNHMITLSHIEGVEIKALCDLQPERAENSKKKLEGTGHNPEIYAGTKDEWKKLCQRSDIDLIFITTPWYMHTQMAVYAMEHGKHAVSEVPAAATIEECWQLVETAERTRKHCMMLENYSYGFFQLLTLNMARQGFFGEVFHGDCAYIESKMANNFSKTSYWNMWWLEQYASRKGNFYPTHGLGPVCQIMNINRGDKLKFLVSVESNDFMMAAKANELANTDDFFKPFVGRDYRGNMNTTIIKTDKGRTIMLQHDGTSPRNNPHSVIHGIFGTKGSAQEYPLPARLSKGLGGWLPQEEYDALVEKYTPAIVKRIGELNKQVGSGHGGGDLIIDWHLIDCLRNGLPLDQDVYDAASWSSVVPLSAWSVLNQSNSIEIPDFTSGAWKTNKQNMDITIKNGGDTKILL